MDDPDDQEIVIGGDWRFRPIVLGPAQVPWVKTLL
jgi:hypothetical protein